MTSTPVRGRRGLAIAGCAVLLGAGLSMAVSAPASAVPSGQTVTLTNTAEHAMTGATVTYVSTSAWFNTNLRITFSGWTANGTFGNTGACPAAVVVTPSAGTNTYCTWAQQGADAVLDLLLTSPSGQNGTVTVTLANGALTNPAEEGPYTVTVLEQSDSGLISLPSTVTITDDDADAAPGAPGEHEDAGDHADHQGDHHDGNHGDQGDHGGHGGHGGDHHGGHDGGDD